MRRIRATYVCHMYVLHNNDRILLLHQFELLSSALMALQSYSPFLQRLAERERMAEERDRESGRKRYESLCDDTVNNLTFQRLLFMFFSSYCLSFVQWPNAYSRRCAITCKRNGIRQICCKLFANDNFIQIYISFLNNILRAIECIQDCFSSTLDWYFSFCCSVILFRCILRVFWLRIGWLFVFFVQGIASLFKIYFS